MSEGIDFPGEVDGVGGLPNAGVQSYSKAVLGIKVRESASRAAEASMMGSVRQVIVSHVANRSRGMRAGLRCGDVIEQVNRKPVNSAEEFETALLQGRNQPLLLLVRRGGETRLPVIGTVNVPD